MKKIKKLFHNISLGNSLNLYIFSSVLLIGLISSTIYSMSYTSYIEDNMQKNVDEINKQIVLNFNNYISGIIEVSDYLIDLSFSKDVYLDKELVVSEFKTSDNIKNDIVSIVLYDYNGNPLINTTNHKVVENVNELDFFVETINNPLVYHFSSIHKQEAFYENDLLEDVVTISRKINAIRVC